MVARVLPYQFNHFPSISKCLSGSRSVCEQPHGCREGMGQSGQLAALGFLRCRVLLGQFDQFRKVALLNDTLSSNINQVLFDESQFCVTNAELFSTEA